MSETTPVADEAYLKELEELTRQYARYAYGDYGLAIVPGGLLFLATGWAFRVGEPFAARVLAAFVAPLLAAFAVQMRSWYQRHGTVRPQPIRAPDPAWNPVWLRLAMPLMMLGILFLQPTALVSRLLAVLSTTVIFVLVWPDRKRPHEHAALLALPVTILLQMDGEYHSKWIDDWGTLAVGVLCVVGGLLSHRTFLRLERRLAKLKSMPRPS